MGRVDGVGSLLAALAPLALPEAGRHGQLQQVLEVAVFRSQFHKVTKILALLAALVFIAGQPGGQPHGVDVQEAQGQLAPFADACRVDVGDVVQPLDILVYLLDFFGRDTVGLAVEPQGIIAQRTQAETVALAAADEGLGQLLLLVHVILLGRPLELLLFLGVELAVGFAQFGHAVDVLLGLRAVRRIVEAPLLVGVQRFVDLVEAVGLAGFGMLDDALPHEDGIGGRSVLGGHLAVLHVGDAPGHVPVQGIGVLLADARPQHLQLLRGEPLLQLERAAAFLLVGRGRPLADVGLVDAALQLVRHVVSGGQAGHGLVEAQVLFGHADVDGAHGRGRVAKVGHLIAVLEPLQAGRRVVLVGAAFEFLLVVHAPLGLGVIVEDDVQSVMSGGIDVGGFNHKAMALWVQNKRKWDVGARTGSLPASTDTV